MSGVTLRDLDALTREFELKLQNIRSIYDQEIKELKVEQVEDKRQIEELLKWKGHANKAALVWASACMGALAVGTSVTGNVEKVKEKLWQLMQ